MWIGGKGEIEGEGKRNREKEEENKRRLGSRGFFPPFKSCIHRGVLRVGLVCLLTNRLWALADMEMSGREAVACDGEGGGWRFCPPSLSLLLLSLILRMGISWLVLK